MSLKNKLGAWGRTHALPYLVSLPERALRSASAVTAGLVREVAQIVVPRGVQQGKLYRNIVDVTLRFLIEQVGQVQDVYPVEERLSADFLLRRTAGNGIELIGILVFWASPVWVLAGFADVCGFGRHLIPEITESLKREGLLEREATFTTMEHMLDGLERSAGRLAETLNTPPLDVAGLRQEWQTFRQEVRSIPASNLPSRSAVTQLWSEVRNEAVRQNRSIFELSSLMAVAAVGKGGSVISNALLDHYRKTLAEIHRVGYVKYGMRQLRPYVRAALVQFSPGQPTWTAKLFK